MPYHNLVVTRPGKVISIYIVCGPRLVWVRVYLGLLAMAPSSRVVTSYNKERAVST